MNKRDEAVLEEFDELFPEVSWGFNSKNKGKSVRYFLLQKLQEERAISEKEKADAIHTAWIMGAKEERERIAGEVESIKDCGFTQEGVLRTMHSSLNAPQVSSLCRSIGGFLWQEMEDTKKKVLAIIKSKE